MKKNILFLFCLFLSAAVFAQTVKNNAEFGNEAIYRAQCWDFNGVSVNNDASALLEGGVALEVSHFKRNPWRTHTLRRHG